MYALYKHTEYSLTHHGHPLGHLQGLVLCCLNSIFIRCLELILIKSFFEPGWNHFKTQALLKYR